MAITVKHKFVSAIPDGTDTTIVRPSNWNDDHDLVGTVPVANGGTGATTAADALTNLGAYPASNPAGYGVGTVTSVTGTSPVSVATGTTTPVVSLAASYGDTQNPYASKTANYVLAAPNGSAGVPTFRALVAADIPALSGTYIPYTGASSAIDLNAQTVTNIAHLGINSTAVPEILFRAYGDNNSTSRIAIRGYSSNASSSSIRIAKFRGTFAAPQAPQSGDSLGKFELAGYGTTSSSGYPQASYEGLATENWGATARGTKSLFYVTPNTTITQAVALTLDQDKSATFTGALSVTGHTTFEGVTSTGATGTGKLVYDTSPTLVTPLLGTPTSGNFSTGTFTWPTFNQNTTGTAANVTGIVLGANGGTGVANTGSTITLGGNLTTSGAFATTLTSTATTALTLPTSGTVISTVTNMAANPVTGTPSSSNFLRGDGTWASPTAGLSTYVRTNFTATAGQTSFTVTYTVGFVEVFVNGVLLDTTDYTSTSGTAIVLATAAALNDIVTVIAYSVTTATAAAGSNTQVQYNSSGSFAGSANLTFNGTTLTAGGLAGPFNGTVGATTASTGAFTTLSASSTVSGTGFSTYLASPPAIGGTAAAAGTFTQLTVNGANLNTAISPTGTGTVTISPTGALTINPTAASTINNASIGATTASTGRFTSITATTGTITPATGTASVAPISLTAGTNLTTAAAGAIEYDGTVPYFSIAASTRGAIPTEQIIVLSGTNTLTSQIAAQPLFDGGGGPTNGAVTLPIGTYQFECNFAGTNLSGTSGTFGFAFGGTATITFVCSCHSNKAGALTTANAVSSVFITSATTSLTAASTNTNCYSFIKGTIRVTVAGTVIPQISLTVAAAAVIQAGSYFKISPIGSSTVVSVGNWS